MSIRAILLDKDGTLVDVFRTLTPAYEAVLADLAGGSDFTFRALARVAGFDPIRKELLPGSPIVPCTPAELARLFAPVLGIEADNAFLARVNALAVRETARHLTATQGALTVVGWLKAQGYGIGISTNTAASHARAELERLDILRHVDFLAGLNSGFGAKPEPGHVFAFAKALAITPAEIACVGDSLYDVRAARAAGAVGVAVLRGTARIDELANEADHVLGSLEELPALLDRIGEGA